MSNSIRLTVHEFSRKLKEPKKIADKWVSSGFEKEIGFRTEKVPLLIENSITNDEFRLNDSYRSEKGNLSLIAREIEQYAVLAIITNLSDDCNRPLLGYRYFWLRTSQDNEIYPEEDSVKDKIDGIGTLLTWWINNNKPCFELKPHQEIIDGMQNNQKNSFYDVVACQEESFEEYRQQLEVFISEVTYIPYIFNKEALVIDDCFELHSYALFLKNNNNLPIAWAWQATTLENPDKFVLIYCIDQNSYNQNIKNCKNQTLLDNLPGLSIPQSNIIDTFPQVNNQTIKEALKRISESKQLDKHFANLVKELKNNDSLRWDWASLIDDIWLRNQAKNEIEAKYRALILLLNPNLNLKNFKNNALDWINSIKFVESKKITSVNQYAQEAVNLQVKLIKLCDKEIKVSEQLRLRIHEIISQLLLLIQKTSVSGSDDRIIQAIEWLFCSSSEVWRFYIGDYFRNHQLLNKLILEKSYKQQQEFNLDNTDSFIQKVIEDYKLSEQNQNKNIYSYSKIAQILENVKAFNTSSFFYQISTSTRQIPKSLSRNFTDLIQIYSVAKKDVVEELESNNYKDRRNINLKLIPLIFLSAVLGIGLESQIKLGDRLFYKTITNNKSEIIPSDPIKELYLYLYLLESGEKREDLKAKNIKNMGELIKNISESYNLELKQEDTREKLLKNHQNLIEFPLYAYVKKNLIQSIPIKLKNNYPAVSAQLKQKSQSNQSILKGPEIQLSKEISRKYLTNYKEININQTWDLQASNAIKEFQTQYNIKPADGYLDLNTWSLLSVMIENEQVKEATEKLKIIIVDSKNYKQFKENHEKIKQCKHINEENFYSKCLEEIKP